MFLCINRFVLSWINIFVNLIVLFELNNLLWVLEWLNYYIFKFGKLIIIIFKVDFVKVIEMLCFRNF